MGGHAARAVPDGAKALARTHLGVERVPWAVDLYLKQRAAAESTTLVCLDFTSINLVEGIWQARLQWRLSILAEC